MKCYYILFGRSGNYTNEQYEYRKLVAYLTFANALLLVTETVPHTNYCKRPEIGRTR